MDNYSSKTLSLTNPSAWTKDIEGHQQINRPLLKHVVKQVGSGSKYNSMGAVVFVFVHLYSVSIYIKYGCSILDYIIYPWVWDENCGEHMGSVKPYRARPSAATLTFDTNFGFNLRCTFGQQLLARATFDQKLSPRWKRGNLTDVMTCTSCCDWYGLDWHLNGTLQLVSHI